MSYFADYLYVIATLDLIRDYYRTVVVTFSFLLLYMCFFITVSLPLLYCTYSHRVTEVTIPGYISGN